MNNKKGSLEQFSLDKIKPNPNNPRLIKDAKFKKLVASISEFPQMMAKRPMVCVTDPDGKIYPLGGNMRLKALQELGYKEIPNEWVTMADDWTEDQRKEFLIKDNVSFGEFDWDVLANEWDSEKLDDWGVDVPKFQEPSDDDEEKAPDLTQKWFLNIEMNSEADTQEWYDKLIKEGLNVKIVQ